MDKYVPKEHSCYLCKHLSCYMLCKALHEPCEYDVYETNDCTHFLQKSQCKNVNEHTNETKAPLKPNLGPKPLYVLLYERVLDLCGCIEKYATQFEKAEYRQNIRNWSNEIIYLCDFMSYMEAKKNKED